MPFTLVDVVNKVMFRQRLLDSADEALTDFSDNKLRVDVDMVIDAINDTVRYVYDICEFDPYATATGTFTLVDGQREYDLNAAFHIMDSEFIKDQTKGHTIKEYPGGFQGMFESQDLPADYIGQPNFWVINPENGKLRLDMAPDPTVAGDVYTYVYTTQLNYAAYDDPMNIPDMVVRDMIPAMVQMYRRESDPTTYDEGRFMSSVAMAVAGLNSQPVKSHYA